LTTNRLKKTKKKIDRINSFYNQRGCAVNDQHQELKSKFKKTHSYLSPEIAKHNKSSSSIYQEHRKQYLK